MAYLELSKEAYEDVLNAAGNRRGAVALKIGEVGKFDEVQTAQEAPPDVQEPEDAPEASAEEEDVTDD